MGALEDALRELEKRVQEYGGSLQTEEATKNAIIMPFISKVLGYDVFNPEEVVPEFIADVGIKRGEKIDYAIKHDGEVHMLIEAKKEGDALAVEHASQLVRYFHTSNARIGVLTNGRLWHFYTDLDRPNVMDGRPFLQLDLRDIDPLVLPHLKKMTKASFDLDSVLAAAEELKFVGAIKRELVAEFTEPSEEFVRLFARRVYSRSLTARVVEQFAQLTEKAVKQFVGDQVNARLKTALGSGSPDLLAPVSEVPQDQSEELPPAEDAAGEAVVTTEDELQAFQIVRAILAAVTPMHRVAIRDAQSYCSVFFDDNNRKPIVRFHFDRKIKRIVLFDREKNMTPVDIEALEDIYLHADALRDVACHYLGGASS